VPHWRGPARRKAFITDEKERKDAVEREYKYLMSEFRRKPLPNVEIKYKWFPSFSWINDKGRATSFDEEGECGYDHFHQKSALLHHKTAIINGELLVNGSYNWSTSAETKNFENLMVIGGPEKQDLKMVSDFQAEFDALWNNPELIFKP
jgi:phosphatidylserine/phosphatidylglycerophosphate/cardiolipin synthase-like enzyme